MDNISGPTFPPLLEGHVVFPPHDPYDVLCGLLNKKAVGAGDIFWLQSDNKIKLSIYLEPEVSLYRSAQMIPISMLAFSEAMGALAPPEFAIHFSWPNIIYANKAKVGKVELHIEKPTKKDQIADFMILSLEIQYNETQADEEPGVTPDITCLSEEGCGHLTTSEIIESYSRHLLTWIHIWEEDGFSSVSQSWIYHALNINQKMTINNQDIGLKGIFKGMTDEGSLLIKCADELKTIPLYKTIREIK